MKTHPCLFLLPAVALGVGACKKTEPAKPDEATPPAAETSAEAPTPGAVVAPVVAPPAAGVEERAAKLGFARHLPADTEVLLSFYNGTKTAERVKESALWKLVANELGAGFMPGGGMDMDDMEMQEEEFELEDVEQDEEMAGEPAAEPMGPAAMFGKEFTIALGKTTSEQTKHLLQLNKRMTYFQMKAIAEAFAEAAKTGDFTVMADAFLDSDNEHFMATLKDPEAGIGLMEKLSMPPLTIAFKAEGPAREDASRQLTALTSNMAMLGEMAEPVDIERNGEKFGGFKVLGSKLSEMIAESREEMEEDLEPAMVDRLIAAVAAKNLVVLNGAIGDYAVLFLGSSEDDLVFAGSPADSLLSSADLGYADGFLSKELIALIHGDDKAVEALMTAAGGMGVICDGLRDGLAGSEGMGDLRELEALFRMVSERESALLSLMRQDGFGTVAFFEDGVKIESFGGTDSGMIDWNKPNTLGALGESSDVALFANLTTNPEYDKKAGEYLESLVETAYAVAMKVSEMDGADEEIAQFQEGVKMFDSMFRPDVTTLLDTLRTDIDGGLGTERALVLDLKGGVPPIPGIPQAVVDEARFPRVTAIRPVTDRAKLGEGWTKLNTSLTGILGKVSEMTGTDIPMQKPISSEKDGFTTWFFSMPFFSDDFMPSVTVGDEWFALSTSKNQSLDLLAQAAAGKPGEAGMTFSVNFQALQEFAGTTIDVLEKNSDDLGIGADDLRTARKAVSAMDDLDKMTLRSFRENGKLRSSFHFKTR